MGTNIWVVARSLYLTLLLSEAFSLLLLLLLLLLGAYFAITVNYVMPLKWRTRFISIEWSLGSMLARASGFDLGTLNKLCTYRCAQVNQAIHSLQGQ